MIVKVALHTHTRRSDGQMSPNEVLLHHHRLGFDAVAITDHDLELTHDEVKQLTIPDGMMVIRGQEESFREFYWQHVNHIYGETKTLRILNHPRRYGMTSDQVLAAVQRFGFDGFEITNQGVYCPQYEHLPLPRVATDDSHYDRMIGRSYMVMEINERTVDAIIDAVLNRTFEIVSNGQRIKP